MKADILKILILWQLRKIVPSPEVSASITINMRSDSVILSCSGAYQAVNTGLQRSQDIVVSLDPQFCSPSTLSAMKTTDPQFPGTAFMVATTKTSENTEQNNDAPEPADRHYQIEFSSH